MTSQTPIRVPLIFSTVPLLAQARLPDDPIRQEAPVRKRYLDSVLMNIDMLEYPPLFSWRSAKDKELREVFFTVLAEDLLLDEAYLRRIDEPRTSKKWENLERLSHELVRVYKKNHRPPSPLEVRLLSICDRIVDCVKLWTA